jgi:hypothetical protein
MKSRSTIKSIIVQAFECTDFCGDGKKIAEKNLSSFILIFLEIKFLVATRHSIELHSPVWHLEDT